MPFCPLFLVPGSLQHSYPARRFHLSFFSLIPACIYHYFFSESLDDFSSLKGMHPLVVVYLTELTRQSSVALNASVTIFNPLFRITY